MVHASQPSETDSSVVLELQRVTCKSCGETSIRLEEFSASVRAGELVTIVLDRHHDPSDFSAILLGLGEVESGQVLFHGEDWHGKEYKRHFRMRSEIGRVFCESAWVQSLTLHDNICLSMLHHGTDLDTAESNVNRWGERILGDPVSSIQSSMVQRPANVEPSILQVGQLIRAVCHQPKLLILERPTRYLPETRYRGLVAAVDELRASGTAVLLLVEASTRDGLQFAPPTTTWSINDNRLTSVAEAAR